MWFDSHSHVYDCDGGGGEALTRARAAGVSGILVAGVDEETSRRAVALASEDDVVAAAGIHPTACAGWEPEWMSPIANLLEDDRVVAAGETGLDFFRDAATAAEQLAAFEAHIELAREHDVALVIHTRDSVDEALDALERAGPPNRFVFHCWSGDEDQLRRALGLGAFVSLAGNVTFRSAGRLRDLAALVPDESLLVETDSPFLAPVPHRGQPNEPAHVVLVGRAVAHARGTSEADVARITAANARRLFALSS